MSESTVPDKIEAEQAKITEEEMTGEEMAGDEKADGGHWSEDMSGLMVYEKYKWMDSIVNKSPKMANLVFLIVASSYATYAGLQVFRYRTKSGYYDVGELGGKATNWWRLSDSARLYGMVGIFGIAFLTQLLASVGIFTSYNMMIWTNLVGTFGMLLGCIISFMRIIGYNAAWSKKEDSKATTAEKTASIAAIAAFDSDTFDDSMMNAAMGVALFANAD